MKKLLVYTIALFTFNCSNLVGQSFIDVSLASGINHVFEPGDYIFGGGVAVIDFDNDGWEDLYITGGSNSDKLYKNNGDGTFSDWTVAAGLAFTANVNTQGVTAADFDNDGYRDLFISVRSPVIDLNVGASNLFLKNNGDGTFIDFSSMAIQNDPEWFTTTSCVGDVNKDGLLDICVGNYLKEPANTLFSSTGDFIELPPINLDLTGNKNQLLINSGGFEFTDNTFQYSVGDTGAPWQVSFLDYDNDLDLDLYVANDFGGVSVPNALFRNEFPTQVFADVGASSGTDAGIGAMGIAKGDFDEDGYIDLYITNTGGNLLFKNDANGSFSEIAESAGVQERLLNPEVGSIRYCFTYQPDPGYQGQDGFQIEHCPTPGTCETITLFLVVVHPVQYGPSDHPNLNNLVYALVKKDSLQTICVDLENPAEVEIMTTPDHGTVLNSFLDDYTLSNGWGCNFIDFDNDSYLDLFVANGSLAIGMNRTTSLNAQIPNSLYKNNGNGEFADVSASAGVKNTWKARGSAVFDYDKDGDLDIFVVCQTHQSNEIPGNASHCLLYRNEHSGNNNWTKIRLVGETSNSDAIGARIELHAANRKWITEVDGGSSSQSQNSLIAHFGLGSISEVDSAVVIWPNGNRESYDDLNVEFENVLYENSSLITSINSTEERDDISVSLFPNPTKDSFTAKIESSHNANGRIEIVDLTGRQMTSSPIYLRQGINLHQQNISELIAGTYLVILQTKESNTVRLMVKN